MGWTSDMDLVVFNTYVYFSHDEKTAYNSKIIHGLNNIAFKKESICIEVGSDGMFCHRLSYKHTLSCFVGRCVFLVEYNNNYS
jgi:hypothetical protein